MTELQEYLNRLMQRAKEYGLAREKLLLAREKLLQEAQESDKKEDQ